jgi:hypothetical protein
VDVQVRYLEPGDDLAGPGRAEGFLLRVPDPLRDGHELVQELVTGVGPLIDLSARDHERVAGPQRRDRQERDDLIVFVDEASGELPVDDPREQRGHRHYLRGHPSG